MYISRNNLDSKFLKDIQFLERKYNVIIMLEYVKDEMVAHIYNNSYIDEIFACAVIGTRESTKERLYVNLSKHLQNVFSK